MRKFFTFCIVFLAMSICANAQTVFSENFDSGMPTGWTQIDANNDGMGWEHSSNPVSYFGSGVDLSGTGHNSSNGFVVSGSYSNVTNTAITPDNWLITPAIQLTANSTLTFWVCGQDASYAAEHYGVYISTTNATSTSAFTMLNQWTIGSSKVQSAWEEKTVDLSAYTGQTVYIAFRHFNCNDQFVLDLDDVTITAQPTSPTIVANPTTIDFGTVILGQTSAVKTSVITAYNLTTGITATTTAPFEVSADGTTFATTATVAQTGGTLYMRYTPTAAGAATGNVTLSSTGATNVTVALTGNGVDCSNSTVSTLPYTQDFEGGVFPPLCWSIENSHPDTTWEAFSYGGTWASCRGTSANRIEKLITVPFNFSSYTHTILMDLTFMSNYTSYVSTGAVDFKVYASTDGGTTWPTTPIWKLSDFGVFTNWTETDVTINLSSLAGQSNVRFAFVYDGRQCQVLFDDVNIYAYNDVTILLSDSVIAFPTTPANSTSDDNISIIAYNLTSGITATTTAPFAVSVDGNTYGTTASIPQAGGTLYVRYAPTAVGTHTGTVALTSGTTTVNIALSGESVDCSNLTVPFTEGFESAIPCWTMVSIDPANDDKFGVYEDADAHAGSQDFRFSSYNSASDYNQYLITPELTLAGSNYMVSFFYKAYRNSDQFRVMYSTTNNNIASFIELQDFQAPATTWTEVVMSLPAGTKYVAINYYGDFAYYLYVDEFSVSPITAPTVTINGPASVVEGSSATFTAVSPLADSFAWTVDGNAVSSTTNTMNYTFTSTGNHTVAVTATNSQGSASASLNVNVYSCGSAVNIPFAENFDGGINECWTILDADGDGYSWESSANPVSYFVPGTDLSGNGHNGSTGFALSGSYSNVTSEALTPNNWLITPMINLSENATLKFWVNAQDANYSAEHYGVYVSTTGTNPSDFTLLFEETIDANGGPREQGAWKQKTANLSNYTGQTVRIAFRHFNCTDEFVFNLDDVEIVPGVGVENHDLQVKIFPNPANSILNINANSNISKVEVYNLLGQNVMTVSVNDINTNINTSNLTAGMYMLKLHTDNGVVNKKFTVAR